MHQSFDRALHLSIESGAFDRGPWGLYGVWGGIIRQWLDESLPIDAAERCRGRVSLVLNKPLIPVPLIPPLGEPLTNMRYPCITKLHVSDFRDRSELIDAALASVHVPLFLDQQWSASFRGEEYVDGSLVLGRGAKLNLQLPGAYTGSPSIRLSPLHDPRMRERYGSGWRDLLRLSSKEAVQEMMRWGELYVDERDDEQLAAGAGGAAAHVADGEG